MARLGSRPNEGGDRPDTALTRRQFGLAVGAALSGAAAACSPPELSAAPRNITPRKPDRPIELVLLDGAGNFDVYQKIYSDFAKTHPHLAKRIYFETASAPDVLGRLRAQALAGEMRTSLVLGGLDVVGDLEKQDLVIPLLPDYQSLLPDLSKIHDKPRAKLQKLVGGRFGILSTWGPSGPVWAYRTEKVDPLPNTPQELLAWAKANPGRLTYAQPSNSGPGRQFMMALPYLLGDKDPSDPINGWSKTWSYLAEIGRYCAAYPAGSTLAYKQLGSGAVWIVPTTTGSDFHNRRENVWGQRVGLDVFENPVWIMDGHSMLVPRGVSPETLYVDLRLMSWVLQPEQQLRTYKHGVYATAVDNAPLEKAGPEAQAIVEKYGREMFPEAFEVGSLNVPLDPVVLRNAFDLWQRRIGSQAG